MLRPRGGHSEKGCQPSPDTYNQTRNSMERLIREHHLDDKEANVNQLNRTRIEAEYPPVVAPHAKRDVIASLAEKRPKKA